MSFLRLRNSASYRTGTSEGQTFMHKADELIPQRETGLSCVGCAPSRAVACGAPRPSLHWGSRSCGAAGTPPGVCPSRHVPPCRTRLPAQVSEPYPALTCPCPHDGRLGRETALADAFPAAPWLRLSPPAPPRPQQLLAIPHTSHTSPPQGCLTGPWNVLPTNVCEHPPDGLRAGSLSQFCPLLRWHRAFPGPLINRSTILLRDTHCH